MKRAIITLTILAIAMPLFAERLPRKETIVVRDGKVFRNGELIESFGGKRAYLGVSLVDITNDLREHYGASKDAGVLVGSVENNGPADKAGVRVGDIILAVDGKDVASSWDLRNALRDKKEGDSVRVDVLRGKARQTLVASVVEKEARVRMFDVADDQLLRGPLSQIIESPEWRARIERSHDCDELQSKLKELETRMKDLEKKLQK